MNPVVVSYPFAQNTLVEGDIVYVKSKRSLGHFVGWEGEKAKIQSLTEPDVHFMASGKSLIWVHPPSLFDSVVIMVVADSLEFRLLAGSQPWPTDISMELGCSYGEATRWLAASTQRVTAIDLAPECIRRATLRVADEEAASGKRFLDAAIARAAAPEAAAAGADTSPRGEDADASGPVGSAPPSLAVAAALVAGGRTPTADEAIAAAAEAAAVDAGRRRSAHPVASRVDWQRLDAIRERPRVIAYADESDVLFLDIGGNRSYATVVLAADALLKGMRRRPRLVVIKARALSKALVEALAAKAAAGVDGGDGAQSESTSAPAAAPSPAPAADGASAPSHCCGGRCKYGGGRFGPLSNRAAPGWWEAAVAGAREEVEGCGSLKRAVMIGMAQGAAAVGDDGVFKPDSGKVVSTDGAASDADGDAPRTARGAANEGEPSAKKKRTPHPLMFPYSDAPDGRAICRYHNYAVCYKGDTCPFDHDHCHACKGKGHKAADCRAYAAQ